MTKHETEAFIEALLAQVHELLVLHEQGVLRDLRVYFGRKDRQGKLGGQPEVQVLQYGLKK